MPAAIVLIGDAEPGPDLDSLCDELLRASGRRRPRVVVVPAAAGRAPDDEFLRVTEAAMDRFRRLGGDVEGVLIRTRDDADDPRHAQAVGEADVIWLTGGAGHHLLDVLAGTAAWEAIADAHARGAPVAGCAAAASALSERSLDARPRFGLPVRWRPGLGLVPRVAILPAYDARPEAVRALSVLIAPRGVTVVGLDRGTAIVGRGDAWQVHGTGRVTVWQGRRRERHRAGEVVRLVAPGPAAEVD